MTYPEQVTDLIQRYLWRVERRLPPKQAADVVAELDSLIRDQLDERALAVGRPVDTSLAVEVLRAFGRPEEAADRYNSSPRYLIGPSAYPVFMKVIGAVGLGLSVVILIQTIVRVITEHTQSLGWILLSSFGALYQSVFFSLAWVVVIFAVMERTQVKRWPLKLDWDPLDLPELPRREEDKATAAGQSLAILGPVFLLLVLNYFPKWAGFVMISSNGGDPTQVHVLRFADLGFTLPMVWINAYLVADALVNLAVLRAGRWNSGLRWAQVFLGVLIFGVLAWTVHHSVKPAPGAADALARSMGIPANIVAMIIDGAHGIAKVIPLLALIAPVKRAYRLVARR